LFSRFVFAFFLASFLTLVITDGRLAVFDVQNVDDESLALAWWEAEVSGSDDGLPFSVVAVVVNHAFVFFSGYSADSLSNGKSPGVWDGHRMRC